MFFSDYFFEKLGQKIFRVIRKSKSRENTQKMFNIIITHETKAFLSFDESEISSTAKIEKKKKFSTSKDYLGKATFLRASVPWKSLNCIRRRPSGRHDTHFSLIVHTAGCESFWKCSQVLRKRITGN